MTAVHTNRPHYPALDGLRGIAIIAVILYHNFPYGEIFFGWLGVDLFFVLSGFLITGILMKSVYPEKESGFLKKFYTRRILRIFPLYYLFLIVFLFVLPALGIWNNEVTAYREHKWWFIFYLQNWLFTNNLPGNSQCLNHFWSLAVEEQYYIIWPFIILWLRKPKKLIAFLLCFLVFLFMVRSYMWYEQYTDFNYTTFYRFTRFDGICIGSLVALTVMVKKDFLLNHTASIVIGLALLNFLFYFLNSNGQLPYMGFLGYTTFASMFGILVYELSYGKNPGLKKIFSIFPLRFLGKISYGLYLFHWPVYFFLHKNLDTFFSGMFNGQLLYIQVLSGLTTTLIAIAFSVVSYYLFEMKFLKLKEKFQ